MVRCPLYIELGDPYEKRITTKKANTKDEDCIYFDDNANSPFKCGQIESGRRAPARGQQGGASGGIKRDRRTPPPAITAKPKDMHYDYYGYQQEVKDIMGSIGARDTYDIFTNYEKDTQPRAIQTPATGAKAVTTQDANGSTTTQVAEPIKPIVQSANYTYDEARFKFYLNDVRLQEIDKEIIELTNAGGMPETTRAGKIYELTQEKKYILDYLSKWELSGSEPSKNADWIVKNEKTGEEWDYTSTKNYIKSKTFAKWAMYESKLNPSASVDLMGEVAKQNMAYVSYTPMPEYYWQSNASFMSDVKVDAYWDKALHKTMFDPTSVQKQLWLRQTTAPSGKIAPYINTWQDYAISTYGTDREMLDAYYKYNLANFSKSSGGDGSWEDGLSRLLSEIEASSDGKILLKTLLWNYENKVKWLYGIDPLVDDNVIAQFPQQARQIGTNPDGTPRYVLLQDFTIVDQIMTLETLTRPFDILEGLNFIINSPKYIQQGIKWGSRTSTAKKLGISGKLAQDIKWLDNVVDASQTFKKAQLAKLGIFKADDWHRLSNSEKAKISQMLFGDSRFVNASDDEIGKYVLDFVNDKGLSKTYNGMKRSLNEFFKLSEKEGTSNVIALQRFYERCGFGSIQIRTKEDFAKFEKEAILRLSTMNVADNVQNIQVKNFNDLQEWLTQKGFDVNPKSAIGSIGRAQGEAEMPTLLMKLQYGVNGLWVKEFVDEKNQKLLKGVSETAVIKLLQEAETNRLLQEAGYQLVNEAITYDDLVDGVLKGWVDDVPMLKSDPEIKSLLKTGKFDGTNQDIIARGLFEANYHGTGANADVYKITGAYDDWIRYKETINKKYEQAIAKAEKRYQIAYNEEVRKATEKYNAQFAEAEKKYKDLMDTHKVYDTNGNVIGIKKQQELFDKLNADVQEAEAKLDKTLTRIDELKAKYGINPYDRSGINKPDPLLLEKYSDVAHDDLAELAKLESLQHVQAKELGDAVIFFKFEGNPPMLPDGSLNYPEIDKRLMLNTSNYVTDESRQLINIDEFRKRNMTPLEKYNGDIDALIDDIWQEQKSNPHIYRSLDADLSPDELKYTNELAEHQKLRDELVFTISDLNKKEYDDLIYILQQKGIIGTKEANTYRQLLTVTSPTYKDEKTLYQLQKTLDEINVKEWNERTFSGVKLDDTQLEGKWTLDYVLEHLLKLQDDIRDYDTQARKIDNLIDLTQQDLDGVSKSLGERTREELEAQIRKAITIDENGNLVYDKSAKISDDVKALLDSVVTPAGEIPDNFIALRAYNEAMQGVEIPKDIKKRKVSLEEREEILARITKREYPVWLQRREEEAKKQYNMLKDIGKSSTVTETYDKYFKIMTEENTNSFLTFLRNNPDTWESLTKGKSGLDDAVLKWKVWLQSSDPLAVQHREKIAELATLTRTEAFNQGIAINELDFTVNALADKWGKLISVEHRSMIESAIREYQTGEINEVGKIVQAIDNSKLGSIGSFVKTPLSLTVIGAGVYLSGLTMLNWGYGDNVIGQLDMTKWQYETEARYDDVSKYDLVWFYNDIYIAGIDKGYYATWEVAQQQSLWEKTNLGKLFSPIPIAGQGIMIVNAREEMLPTLYAPLVEAGLIVVDGTGYTGHTIKYNYNYNGMILQGGLGRPACTFDPVFYTRYDKDSEVYQHALEIETMKGLIEVDENGKPRLDAQGNTIPIGGKVQNAVDKMFAGTPLIPYQAEDYQKAINTVVYNLGGSAEEAQQMFDPTLKSNVTDYYFKMAGYMNKNDPVLQGFYDRKPNADGLLYSARTKIDNSTAQMYNASAQDALEAGTIIATVQTTSIAKEAVDQFAGTCFEGWAQHKANADRSREIANSFVEQLKSQLSPEDYNALVAHVATYSDVQAIPIQNLQSFVSSMGYHITQNNDDTVSATKDAIKAGVYFGDKKLIRASLLQKLAGTDFESVQKNASIMEGLTYAVQNGVVSAEEVNTWIADFYFPSFAGAPRQKGNLYVGNHAREAQSYDQWGKGNVKLDMEYPFMPDKTVSREMSFDTWLPDKNAYGRNDLREVPLYQFNGRTYILAELPQEAYDGNKLSDYVKVVGTTYVPLYQAYWQKGYKQQADGSYTFPYTYTGKDKKQHYYEGNIPRYMPITDYYLYTGNDLSKQGVWAKEQLDEKALESGEYKFYRQGAIPKSDIQKANIYGFEGEAQNDVDVSYVRGYDKKGNPIYDNKLWQHNVLTKNTVEYNGDKLYSDRQRQELAKIYFNELTGGDMPADFDWASFVRIDGLVTGVPIKMENGGWRFDTKDLKAGTIVNIPYGVNKGLPRGNCITEPFTQPSDAERAWSKDRLYITGHNDYGKPEISYIPGWMQKVEGSDKKDDKGNIINEFFRPEWDRCEHDNSTSYTVDTHGNLNVSCDNRDSG